MGHIGIIAEYNPFHNGHYYQIQQAKLAFPDKKVIAIMSGDFVQRGEPAVFNKYLRTSCALQSGIDLIFEMPPICSTASAEHFACAGVLALAKTGIVDTLCFGAEQDNLDIFYSIASFLLDETPTYQQKLKYHLKNGNSYPKARSLAIQEFFPDYDIENFLKSPNNILGLEYVKAILKYHLDIKPFPIKRQLSDYHSEVLSNTICSATALRTEISKNNITTTLSNYIPNDSWNCLANHSEHHPLFMDNFYPILLYCLWDKRDTLELYLDINEELANKLRKLTHFPTRYQDLVESLYGRNYTKSRIRHSLLNILLSITKEDMTMLKHQDYICYLRILGFQKDARLLLKEIKDKSSLPLINKTANAYKCLNTTAQKQFQCDLHISNLYQQVYEQTYQHSLLNEYERSVIIADCTHIV